MARKKKQQLRLQTIRLLFPLNKHQLQWTMRPRRQHQWMLLLPMLLLLMLPQLLRTGISPRPLLKPSNHSI